MFFCVKSFETFYFCLLIIKQRHLEKMFLFVVKGKETIVELDMESKIKTIWALSLLYFSLTKFSPCLTFCLLCTTMAAPSLIRFCCILLPVCLSSTLAAIDEISINQQESWPRLASSSSSLSANEASAQNINDTLTSAKMKRNRKKLR